MAAKGRLVFRGSLRRLNYGRWDRELEAMVVAGMEQYLCSNRILFKDYLDHVKGVSCRILVPALPPRLGVFFAAAILRFTSSRAFWKAVSDASNACWILGGHPNPAIEGHLKTGHR
jgi:hypothetical protein